jgi:hypothetical protein
MECEFKCFWRQICDGESHWSNPDKTDNEGQAPSPLYQGMNMQGLLTAQSSRGVQNDNAHDSSGHDVLPIPQQVSK